MSTPLERDLAALTEELGDLLPAREIPRLSNDEVVVAFAAIEAHARRVEALQVALAAEVEERTTGRAPVDSLSDAHGCRNAVELLQRLTRRSARTLRRRIRLGSLTRPQSAFGGGPLPARYPAVAEALARGELAAEAASLITDMLERSRPSSAPDEAAVAEQCLVDAATGNAFVAAADDGPEREEALGDRAAREAGNGCAVPSDADGIRVMCTVWRQYLDPDGTLPDEEAAFAKRGFRFGRERKGLVPVTGALTVEVAALLARLFDAVNSPRVTEGNPAPSETNAARREADGRDRADDENLGSSGSVPADVFVSATPHASGSASAHAPASAHASDSSSAREPGGVRFHPAPDSGAGDGISAASPPPALTADDRSPDQKRHDALAVFLETIARHPDTPLLGGAPVTVLLQVPEEDLVASEKNVESGSTTRTQRGNAWIHGHDGSPAPVSMRAAHYATCAGVLQRITQASNGRIIGIESPRRVFTPHQRRAITLRDGGCVIPGCTVPATWCEIHHVTEYSEGGPTHTDNGCLLCWYHHRNLEPSGWRIRIVDGMPETQAPRWLDPDRRWWPIRPPTRPPDRRTGLVRAA